MPGGIMIKKRNMIAQFFLAIVTLGFYCIYWFYVTCKEMAEYKKISAEPGLYTVLMFIPLANFWAIYKYSELYENFSNGTMNKWLMFVLCLVFSPAVWIIVQSALNKEADKVA
jgi:hypothetical protein